MAEQQAQKVKFRSNELEKDDNILDLLDDKKAKKASSRKTKKSVSKTKMADTSGTLVLKNSNTNGGKFKRSKQDFKYIKNTKDGQEKSDSKIEKLTQKLKNGMLTMKTF